jgi:hypothetical protein
MLQLDSVEGKSDICESDLARVIPSAHQVQGDPKIRSAELVTPLREASEMASMMAQ